MRQLLILKIRISINLTLKADAALIDMIRTQPEPIKYTWWALWLNSPLARSRCPGYGCDDKVWPLISYSRWLPVLPPVVATSTNICPQLGSTSSACAWIDASATHTTVWPNQWRIQGGGGGRGFNPPPPQRLVFFFFACQYMKIPRVLDPNPPPPSKNS